MSGAGPKGSENALHGAAAGVTVGRAARRRVLVIRDQLREPPKPRPRRGRPRRAGPSGLGGDRAPVRGWQRAPRTLLAGVGGERIAGVRALGAADATARAGATCLAPARAHERRHRGASRSSAAPATRRSAGGSPASSTTSPPRRSTAPRSARCSTRARRTPRSTSCRTCSTRRAAVPPLTVTGTMDGPTRQATVTFQGENGLQRDCIVGPLTWAPGPGHGDRVGNGRARPARGNPQPGRRPIRPRSRRTCSPPAAATTPPGMEPAPPRRRPRTGRS